MTKKSQTQIEIVNELVKMSFGREFSGDCILFSNHSGNHMIKSDRLESIAKRKWLYIPRLHEKYETAGIFTSEDGSKLNVEPGYSNEAIRYATYYSLHFKKNASVNGKEIPIEFDAFKQ